MFRRKYKPKAPEPEMPADLEKLGLFINDDDQLRQIENRSEPFEYYFYGKGGKLDGSSPNEQLNQRRREAVDECLRRITIERLTSPPYSLKICPLPSADGPHVNILSSSPEALSTASRILMIFPDPVSSSLGMFALRMAVDDSIRTGNMETFLQRVYSLYDAVVIANPAMLNWDAKSKTSVSDVTWRARRLKALTAAHILDSDAGVRIPGHECNENHVFSVFEYLKTHITSTGANIIEPKIDFLAVGYTAYSVLIYLSNEQQWAFWGPRMHTGCLAESPHLLANLPLNISFRNFLRCRVRNYATNDEQRGSFLPEQLSAGCAAFSAEGGWAPKIVPDCLDDIVEYLKRGFQFPVAPQEDEDLIEEGLNPFIPLMLGDGGGAGLNMKSWQEAMMRLDLGYQGPGWEVPGMEEVIRLKEMQDPKEENPPMATEERVDELKEEEQEKKPLILEDKMREMGKEVLTSHPL